MRRSLLPAAGHPVRAAAGLHTPPVNQCGGPLLRSPPAANLPITLRVQLTKSPDSFTSLATMRCALGPFLKHCYPLPLLPLLARLPSLALFCLLTLH